MSISSWENLNISDRLSCAMQIGLFQSHTGTTSIRQVSRLVRTVMPSHVLPLQGSFDEVPGLTEELYSQLAELRAWMAYCYADRSARAPA